MKKTQYALVHKKSGDYATLCHQDDIVTPMLASSLNELFDLIYVWSDMDTGAALKEMQQEGSEFYEFEIVRQTVMTVKLSKDEMAKISAEIAEHEKQEEAWRKKYGAADDEDD